MKKDFREMKKDYRELKNFSRDCRTLKVNGLNIEKYIGRSYDKENQELTRYILFVTDFIGFNYSLTLWESCEIVNGSYSTEGHCEVKQIDEVSSYDYVPETETTIYGEIIFGSEGPKLVTGNRDLVKNKVFVYSSYGGRRYDFRTFSGFLSFNMRLFVPTKGKATERPVMIFTGNSAVGKATIASHLDEFMVVYETDASDKLPDTIFASVIIVGEKNNFTVDEIKEHLPKNTKAVVVTFEEN